MTHIHSPVQYHLLVIGLPDETRPDDTYVEPVTADTPGFIPDYWINYLLESSEDDLAVGRPIIFGRYAVLLHVEAWLPDNGNHRRVQVRIEYYGTRSTLTRAELRDKFFAGLNLHRFTDEYACSDLHHCAGRELIPA